MQLVFVFYQQTGGLRTHQHDPMTFLRCNGPFGSGVSVSVKRLRAMCQTWKGTPASLCSGTLATQTFAKPQSRSEMFALQIGLLELVVLYIQLFVPLFVPLFREVFVHLIHRSGRL